MRVWVLLAAAPLLLCTCRAHPPAAHPQRWAKAWIDAANSQRLEDWAALLGYTGTYQDPFTVVPLSGPKSKR
jgi:hypothetical protein